MNKLHRVYVWFNSKNDMVLENRHYLTINKDSTYVVNIAAGKTRQDIPETSHQVTCVRCTLLH